MDQIDINLSQAWARISDACKRDRIETLRRFRRSHGYTMRGTPRAWCAVLRAADTRINPHTAAIEFDEIESPKSKRPKSKEGQFTAEDAENAEEGLGEIEFTAEGAESAERDQFVKTSIHGRMLENQNSFSAISAYSAVPMCSDTSEAVARGVPHVVTLDGALIRRLIKPIEIAWPGVPRATAANILGVSDRSVENYLKAGTLKLWGYDTATMQSQRGKPVPIVYTAGKIDPGAMAGAAPDPIWGTLWHYRHEDIPVEYVLRARRVPRWKFINGRMKLLGWDWICPGRFETNLTAEIAELAEEELGKGEFIAEGAARDQFVRTSIHDQGLETQNGFSALSANSAVNSRCGLSTIQRDFSAISASSAVNRRCGRRVRYLYGPLPVWTLAKSLGANLDLELPEGCGLAGTWNPGMDDRWAGMRSFACKHCWNLRGMTLTSSSGWNDFVTWLSGGLLYGHEVDRPLAEAPRRRRHKFAHHVHPRCERFRERLLPLLLEDESREVIARRLGVKIGVVDSHTKVIYRRHRVHSRSQLAKKLGKLFVKRAAASAATQARIVGRRRVVLKLRRAGMNLRQIARELKINLKTAHADVIALRLQGRLPGERATLRLSDHRPTPLKLRADSQVV